MNDSLLVVEALTHHYGECTALSNINFHIARAEIFGLLGPNGGGKTTLFRVMCTLMKPSVGRVIMDGGPVDRRRIGVVFQSPSLDKKLTVRENLLHQGHIYGLHGAALQLRISELLRRFAIEDRTRDFVETLSGGLRRRVELAKGLLHKPALLLLDEPSTGLDPRGRRQFGDYLEELRDENGVTIVLTTHIAEEADRCDRIAILDHGRLVALDTPAALKERVGGDVIVVETGDAETLCGQLRAKFDIEATWMDRSVRLERPRGHEFIPQLVEAFAPQIDAVSVHKPTLDDVFIQLTGHRFEGDQT